jgi:diaminopropionate ammonia-lyase
MPVTFVKPRSGTPRNLFDDRDFAEQRAFFAARPALPATPLRTLPGLATALGVGALLIKDETSRFGLNAFKSAGTTFAIGMMRERGQLEPGATLVCASEGNHGRAVARAARDADCAARVYMAASVTAARVRAIESEGARVIRVDGTYDDAVRRMAADASANGWTIVSDTSWPGYEEVPRLIMLGYTRLLDEAESAWSTSGRPDVLFVQGGVGGLLAATACWAEWRFGPDRPAIVAVEPATAACLQTSARHGRPTKLDGPFDTIMGGLRCGEVSPIAFSSVDSIVDGYIAIEDTWALAAIRTLARPREGDPPVEAGASGAAALGALLATLQSDAAADLRRHVGLGRRSRVLAFVTEGVTEPADFALALASDPRGRG